MCDVIDSFDHLPVELEVPGVLYEAEQVEYTEYTENEVSVPESYDVEDLAMVTELESDRPEGSRRDMLSVVHDGDDISIIVPEEEYAELYGVLMESEQVDNEHTSSVKPDYLALERDCFGYTNDPNIRSCLSFLVEVGHLASGMKMTNDFEDLINVNMKIISELHSEISDAGIELFDFIYDKGSTNYSCIVLRSEDTILFGSGCTRPYFKDMLADIALYGEVMPVQFKTADIFVNDVIEQLVQMELLNDPEISKMEDERDARNAALKSVQNRYDFVSFGYSLGGALSDLVTTKLHHMNFRAEGISLDTPGSAPLVRALEHSMRVAGFHNSSDINIKTLLSSTESCANSANPQHGSTYIIDVRGVAPSILATSNVDGKLVSDIAKLLSEGGKAIDDRGEEELDKGVSKEMNGDTHEDAPIGVHDDASGGEDMNSYVDEFIDAVLVDNISLLDNGEATADDISLPDELVFILATRGKDVGFFKEELLRIMQEYKADFFEYIETKSSPGLFQLLYNFDAHRDINSVISAACCRYVIVPAPHSYDQHGSTLQNNKLLKCLSVPLSLIHEAVFIPLYNLIMGH